MGLVSQAVHDGGRHVIGYHSLSLVFIPFSFGKVFFSFSIFSKGFWGKGGSRNQSQLCLFVLFLNWYSICHVIVSCRVIPKTLMPREVCLLQPWEKAYGFFLVIKFCRLFLFLFCLFSSSKVEPWFRSVFSFVSPLSPLVLYSIYVFPLVISSLFCSFLFSVKTSLPPGSYSVANFKA